MDNNHVADFFTLLSKLIDIHGGDGFKSKSYSSAAFAIEKLPVQLTDLPVEKLSSLKGIGASTSKKITEILETGQLKALEEIIFNTPPGVIEMLNIKGIGPKKIHTIWKEMQIESVGELLYACQENRLKIYKGFGEKTQQSISDTIEFYLKSKDRHLYSQLTLFTEQTTELLIKIFGDNKVFITGEFKRQLEIIDDLDFVVNAKEEVIKEKLSAIKEFAPEEKKNGALIYKTSSGVKIRIYYADDKNVMARIIETSSSAAFYKEFLRQNISGIHANQVTEKEVFNNAGFSFIPACLREDPAILNIAKADSLPELIQIKDIRGIIHCHSNWSDGTNTIEELAFAAQAKGMEYLVISDHSKTAFYANGLFEDRIKQQHQYINELNERLAPFRIFKSIESDILNDGSLDYGEDILSSFDMIIASVHSNLKMTEEKAMKRLIGAIQNPYTTILGHMTGRLLLSRNGYPVVHKEIIDACAANNVIIELNANPRRLDVDWRQIPYALKKNVLISIDPDAHFIEGFDDIRFGVLVAQKAMVKPENNFSSFSLSDFEAYLSHRKKSKGI
ncbi:MAG: helix-hairpin-helix domain-containing protein [Ferruginibacter sp.]